MEHKTGTTRGMQYSAIDPKTGRLDWQALVPKRVIDRACKRGIGAAKEIDHSVAGVLRKPTAVFHGLCRDRDDDNGQTDGWYCFVGVPTQRFDPATGDSIPRRDRVLLVFMNREKEIYSFRWEESDPNDPDLPADCGNDRFKEKLL